MNITDAAKRMGVSERTIKRWIKRGWLHTTKVSKVNHLWWRHEISIDALVEADDRRNQHSLNCAGERRATWRT